MSFPVLIGLAMDSLGLTRALIRHFKEHFETPWLVGISPLSSPSPGVSICLVFCLFVCLFLTPDSLAILETRSTLSCFLLSSFSF